MPPTTTPPRLDAHQQAAVDAPLGPVAMLAGPGAGKTHTVVARIAALAAAGVDPAGMVALCHTQKAAGELRDRLWAHGLGAVRCATIHALAYQQLRRWAPVVTGQPAPELLASAWGWVRDAAVAELGAPGADPALVHELLAELDWARACGLDRRRYGPAAKRAGRTLPVGAPQLTAIWRRLDERKAAAGVVEFCDVLTRATALYTHPEAAAALRAEHTAFFVDEYQDVDASQQAFLEACLGDRDALTVVGDVDQAIFRFKGGDPSLLTGFAARWPGAHVVELVRNYRSSPEIVAWVNMLAGSPRSPLVAVGPSGPRPELVAARDEAAEEHALVTRIHRWCRAGLAPEAIAVLYRFNASAARLEAALAAAGIPYHVAGAHRFFDRPEVRAVLVPFGQAARRDPAADGPALLVAAAAGCGHDRSTPPAGMGAVRGRWEAVEALCALADGPLAGLAAGPLLAELQARARGAQDPNVGGVCLATVHAAKGKEWDAVWVCGMAEGQLPSSYAKTAAQLAEERNLAYVAVSRARRELVVSYAARRANGWTQRPSRYLTLLGYSLEDDAAGPGRSRGGRRGDDGAGDGARPSRPEPARSRARCGACGEELRSIAAREAGRCSARCLTGAPAARHAALLAWRAERAEALGVSLTRVAPDRAVFSLAVCGTRVPVTGVHPEAGPLPG